MLTSPRPAVRPAVPSALRPALGAAALVSALTALAAPLPPAVAQPAMEPLPAGAAERPAGLIVLEERPSQEGQRVLGLYAPRQDPANPDLWRVQLWQQRGASVVLSTDTLNCSPGGAMRLTREGDRWLLRQLNPGGLITPANRLDHLVWWATCHPQQAGRDPATLAPLARQLGHPGDLRETEQVLPGRAR
jgi:hypothetical protein